MVPVGCSFLLHQSYLPMGMLSVKQERCPRQICFSTKVCIYLDKKKKRKEKNITLTK